MFLEMKNTVEGEILRRARKSRHHLEIIDERNAKWANEALNEKKIFENGKKSLRTAIVDTWNDQLTDNRQSNRRHTEQKNFFSSRPKGESER